jgi:arginyl-tRNA synthetase
MIFCQSLKQEIKKKLGKIIDLSNILIKLEIHKKEDEIIYKSPLCLQLTKIIKFPPLIIAQKIVNLWNDHEITIKISGQGWLEFTVSNLYLSQWLQQLTTNSLNCYNHKFVIYRDPFVIPSDSEESPKNLNLQTNNNRYFKLIYAQARCCSLLRSADRDQLIELANLDFQDFNSYWKAPQPLIFSEEFFDNIWHKKLVRELAIINDIIIDNFHQKWENIALSLAEKILDFERYCRIWGEVKQFNLNLSQTRLALLGLSQSYLQAIMKAKLGVLPPLEL